jgi:hypothetical protein
MCDIRNTQFLNFNLVYLKKNWGEEWMTDVISEFCSVSTWLFVSEDFIATCHLFIIFLGPHLMPHLLYSTWLDLE